MLDTFYSSFNEVKLLTKKSTEQVLLSAIFLS